MPDSQTTKTRRRVLPKLAPVSGLEYVTNFSDARRTRDDPQDATDNPQTTKAAGFDLRNIVAKTWTLTNQLRWRGVPHTTTEPRVLEQAWRCIETGELSWTPVPLEIIE